MFTNIKSVANRPTNILEYEGQTFYIINKTDSSKIEHLIIYDALIIEAGEPEFTARVIRKIRSHYNPEYYLKPIFILGDTPENEPFINSLIDGKIHNLNQLDIINEKYKSIFLKTSDLYFASSLSFEAQIINKVLNFMYTRGKKEIKPYPYFRSGIGYTYPEISVNFAPHEEWQSLDILEIAEREGLFSKQYFEKIFLCSKCKGGFLTYREICTICNSSDLHTDDLVHHFPCAYVGPASDFKNQIDSDLTCPKCYKTLRHIGVDYDKPSIIHTCRNCGNKFQDITIMAKCVMCHSDVEVENLIPKQIYTYAMGKKGENVVLNGYLSTDTDLESINGTVDLKTFKTFMYYEIERLRQNDSNSNIALLYLKKANELFSRIGTSSQKKFLNELIGAMRENIRTSDLIAFDGASTLLLLINDIPKKIANSFLTDISELLNKLIIENYADFDVEIKFDLQQITKNMSVDAQIQKLSESIL